MCGRHSPPAKLAQMKETFAIEAARNSVYPVGGGLWCWSFTQLRVSTAYREWNLGSDITRMGSSRAGLIAYLDDGYLCTSTTCSSLQRTKIRSQQRLPAGPAQITISTEYAEIRPGGPLNITIGAPLAFTANDCLDIGVCLGGRVSLDDYDRAPFPFNGSIKNLNVRYTS